MPNMVSVLECEYLCFGFYDHGSSVGKLGLLGADEIHLTTWDKRVFTNKLDRLIG